MDFEKKNIMNLKKMFIEVEKEGPRPDLHGLDLHGSQPPARPLKIHGGCQLWCAPRSDRVMQKGEVKVMRRRCCYGG